MTPNARRLSLVIGCLVIGGTAAAFAWFSMQAASGAARASEPLQCTLATPTATSPHPGMAWVPPGRFRQGDTREPEERIIESTQVSGFWMDRTEVTNAQFAEFVRATGFRTQAERPLDASKHPELPASLLKPGALVFTPPRSVNTMANPAQWWTYLPGASWQQPGGNATSIATRGEFPVVAVTYEDAMAYARWKGRDLPSEAEWEWAAQGANLAQANTWQGLFPVVNSGDDGFIGLAPVGCYPPNALGLYDMIGNVWELTKDAWQASNSARQRVIKGGSYLCAPNYCARYRSGARQPQDEDLAASHLGFRTVLRATGP